MLKNILAGVAMMFALVACGEKESVEAAAVEAPAAEAPAAEAAVEAPAEQAAQ